MDIETSFMRASGRVGGILVVAAVFILVLLAGTYISDQIKKRPQLHQELSRIDTSLKHYLEVVTLGWLQGTFFAVLIFIPVVLLDFLITKLFGFKDLMMANLNQYWFFAYYGAFLVIGGYRHCEEQLRSSRRS